MSQFRNQNFINQIIKDTGLLKIDDDTCQILQLLVEIQTRKLIQHSAKFMRNDSRDTIHFEDVENALLDLNHHDIHLLDQEENFFRDGSTFIRSDPLFKTAKDFIEEETKLLPLNLFSLPSLKGRWIYLEGKIPKTNQNAALKSKNDILSVRYKAFKEKDKKFNIISDCPENLFTSIEEEYFKDVTSLLSSLAITEIGKLESIDIQGNITNLLPMLLNYFNSTEMTQAKMIYFLKMLNNKYVERSIEYHLHQILVYLWAYEGVSCFKVGLKIGQIIRTFGVKYPTLYRFQPKQSKYLSKMDIFERQSFYATLIKRIAIEFCIGVTVEIDDKMLEMCEQDAKEGSSLGIQLKSVISEYSSQISSLNDQLSIFNIPSTCDEPYLMMPL